MLLVPSPTFPASSVVIADNSSFSKSAVNFLDSDRFVPATEISVDTLSLSRSILRANVAEILSLTDLILEWDSISLLLRSAIPVNDKSLSFIDSEYSSSPSFRSLTPESTCDNREPFPDCIFV